MQSNQRIPPLVVKSVGISRQYDCFDALYSAQCEKLPDYQRQTKGGLCQIMDISNCCLKEIIGSLDYHGTNSSVAHYAYQMGYLIDVPDRRQFLTIKKVEDRERYDPYTELRERDNAAFYRDPETGCLEYSYFPGDD